MKVVLLFCLVGACFANQWSQWNHWGQWSQWGQESQWNERVSQRRVVDNSFQSGREYRFVYDGQLASGIPGSSKQHSSHRIQALVVVAFKSRDQALMRLEHIRMGQLNREISNPKKIMPFDAFEDVVIEQHLKEKLDAVVSFTYTHGLVRRIVFDAREDSWSSNIKRSILNMLQVNMQQPRRFDTAEIRLNNNFRDEQTGNAFFYNVMEKSMEGECETLYTVQKSKDVLSSFPTMNITKSINFEKCTKRPQIQYNFRFSDSCPTCESKYNDDEKFFKTSTVAQYNITGNENQFLIDSVRFESEYIFTPFNEETNVIVSYVNQTLVLVKTGPIENSMVEPTNTVESDSHMVFSLDWDTNYEKFHSTSQHEYSKELLGAKTNFDKTGLAKSWLRKLVLLMKEQLDSEVPRSFLRVVDAFRMLSESELERVVNGHEFTQMTMEDQQHAKNLIPQVLGVCGTKACVKYLTHGIRDNRINTPRSIMALKALLSNPVVSKEIIDELKSLLRSSKVQENKPLKSQLWLTIGSMIHALCGDNEDKLALEMKPTPEEQCDMSLKNEYVKFLFNELRKTDKWEDKVLIMKSIANAGLSLSVFELEKIIRQTDNFYPMYVRFEAISALRQLKQVMQKKLQRLLLPVVMDRKEHSLIRSAASYILFQTLPERPILDQLARQLNIEPSQQLASFLYSQMTAYANSTNPCEKKMATDLKLALRNAKKIDGGFGYSKLGKFSTHNVRQSIGADMDYDVVFSNSSIMPRHLSASLHLNLMGFWNKYLSSFSLFNEGLLESYARQMIERGLMNSDALFRQHPRDTTANEYVRELNELFNNRLGVKSRDFSYSATEQDQQPKAYLSSMYKSQTVNYLPISKESIDEIVRDAAGGWSNVQQKLIRGMGVEYSTVTMLNQVFYKIPTILGLPIVYTLNSPLALNLKGSIRVVPQSNNQFKIQAQVKPSIVASVISDVMIWSPVLNSGVKLETTAKVFTPIDVKLTVGLSTPSPIVKLTVTAPTHKRDLLVLETRPITYTRNWQAFIRDEESSSDEKTIYGEEVKPLTTWNNCTTGETLGVKFCIRGQSHCEASTYLKNTPVGPFSGLNKLVITAEPSHRQVREIELDVTGEIKRVMNPEEVNQWSPLTQSTDNWNSEENSFESSSQERYSSEIEQQQQQQRQSTSNNRYTNNGKWYKTKLTAGLRTDGRQIARLDMTSMLDADNRQGKVDLKYKHQHPYSFETCLKAEMIYPEKPTFVNDVRNKKVLGNVMINWGSQCSPSNYIRLVGQAERSQQQIDWESQRSDYQQYRDENCRRNKVWCSPLTQEDVVEDIAQLLKYRLDIEYQNVPAQLKNISSELYRALKYAYYWQTDINDVEIRNPENKIRAEMTLDSRSRQHVNVTIKTPRENIRIKNMPLSKPISFTVNPKKSFTQQLKELIHRDQQQPECKLTGRSGWEKRSQIETFDGVRYSVPLTDCWTVLAKDCGSARPQFVVMTRRTERNSDSKLVKIVTPFHRVELKPETDEYDSVKVTVNGQVMDVSEQEYTHHEHVVLQVRKSYKIVSIRLPETGVLVQFDGYAITVKMSPLYQSQQCGLCGHYDLESADEFRNPDFTSEEDLRQYFINYLVKDDRCQVPKLNDVCTNAQCDKDTLDIDTFSSSSSEEIDNDNDITTERPVLKNKIIHRFNKICFSTEPVPTCNEDSYPIQKQQRKISYVCMDRDSADRYEHSARHQRSRLEDLRTSQPIFFQMELIPEKCKEYTRN